MFSHFPHWIHSPLCTKLKCQLDNHLVAEWLHWLTNGSHTSRSLTSHQDWNLYLWPGPHLLLWQNDVPVSRGHACFCALSQPLLDEPVRGWEIRQKRAHIPGPSDCEPAYSQPTLNSAREPSSAQKNCLAGL